jgi:oligoribonuclease NrnB/cAMP/cGMP phosphodiesterase (DHH superfamily)
MKLFHISHTDLDGYTCQLITSLVFSECEFFNSHYGPEILAHVDETLNIIKNSSKEEEYMILITDLNLTIEYSEQMLSKLNPLIEDGYKITLQLLDHHGTGKDCDAKYDWYYLDTTRSATKITYDFFKEKYGYSDSIDEWLSPFVKAVNAVDIWLENDSSFEFGKVCLRLIAKANEINKIIFKDQNIDYKFYLLKEASKYLSKENAHIALDENIYFIKKDYIKKDKNDTFDNLLSSFIEHLITNELDKFTVNYGEYKGVVTYQLGGISVVANHFLKKHPEYAFFIDVSHRGSVSIRGHDIIDVSAFAKKFFDGGGHPNASGGKIKDFKESFQYEVVKNQIVEIISKK